MTEATKLKLKNLAWKVYLYFYILLTGLNFLSLIALVFNQDLMPAGTRVGTIVTEFFKIGFTIIYLLGLHGFINQKAYGLRRTWRFLFYLMCLGFVSIIIIGFFSQNLMEVIGFVMGILIAAPWVYALYQYSDKSFPVWTSTERSKQAAQLAALLSNYQSIIASAQYIDGNDDETTTATITKSQNEITVDLEKVVNGEIKQFTNTFDHEEGVVKFLEENTVLRVGDFKSSN